MNDYLVIRVNRRKGNIVMNRDCMKNSESLLTHEESSSFSVKRQMDNKQRIRTQVSRAG